MRNNYKLVIFSMLFMLLFTYTAQAQLEEGDVIWQDMFDDPVNDYLTNNIGWLRFTPEQGLVGQITEQDGLGSGGRAYIKAGSFTVLDAGLIQTNGFNPLIVDNMDSSEVLMSKQNQEIAEKMVNHVISFTINFKKMKSPEDGDTYPMGSYFICASGMRRSNPDDAYADPTEDSTYAVYISPFTNTTAIVKFGGNMNVANPSPSVWTFLDIATPDSAEYMEYEMGVDYNVKFWLNGNDYKVKVWEGDEEPDEYLLEATDTDPWERGVWTVFSTISDPQQEENRDEYYLDNVVVKELLPSFINKNDKAIPYEFALKNNYPNPFNPTTTIEYSLDKADDVTINVYSVTGELVRTLTNASMSAGSHKVTFNGLDNNGNPLSSGVYFYSLQTSNRSITKKMILMK